MSEIHLPAQRRPFMSPKTLAAYLELSERTVRQMLADGVIPSYLIGGARRIDPTTPTWTAAATPVHCTPQSGPATMVTSRPRHQGDKPRCTLSVNRGAVTRPRRSVSTRPARSGGSFDDFADAS